jgi:hypothetical protein
MYKLVAAILCLIALSAGLGAQDAPPVLLDRVVPQFTASGTTEYVVSRLASSVGGFMGTEGIDDSITKNGPRATSTEAPNLAMSACGKTVKQILDLIVAQDSRYTYVISGDWINLVPAGVADDPNYVYNRRMPGNITVSTDPAACTDTKPWFRENKISCALLVIGDMTRSLPVSAQTVRLTNPTLREYTNWDMKLAGKNRWSSSVQSIDGDGKVRMLFSYSVVSNN